MENTMERTLNAAASYAVKFLRELGERPVNATCEAQLLRERLDRPLANEEMDPERVIEALIAGVEGGIVGMPSGRFFAWVIGGSLPSALAADWLTSVWGQNAALYGTSPAASVVEEIAGQWLKEILGLPASASFAFVTGCQMAHVTCLAAARNALLRERAWDVEARGLAGAPQMRVLATERVHASMERALRLLGFGTDCMRLLHPNEREMLDPIQLQAALDEDTTAPTIVVLQAGEINTGTVEPFATLIPVAKQCGAWVHVDGAFGLWAAASPLYRHLTEGVQGADSWATDGHKWLNVPFDCGYAFVRDSSAHRSAMSVSAPYIAASSELRDPIDWNPEWSRRARGFATYAALMELGRGGVSGLIERTCRHARSIVDALGKLPGVEILWRPLINQGLVRFLDPRLGAGDADHDRRTEAVVRRIVASGEAFFAPTAWRGKRAMRVSVLNWRTSDEDVRRAVDAAERELQMETVAS
jgi:glutamate/tyrosine decarboxylase-like PLP-dependent enzyme